MTPTEKAPRDAREALAAMMEGSSKLHPDSPRWDSIRMPSDEALNTAALAHQAESACLAEAAEPVASSDRAYQLFLATNEHELGRDVQIARLGQMIHHLSERLRAKGEEIRTLRGMISGGLGADTETLDTPQPSQASETKSLNAAVADALRPYLSAGQKVIWRDAFRWKDDNGVMPNHYEMMSLQGLAADFGYEVIHDCECAGIIKEKVNG